MFNDLRYLGAHISTTTRPNYTTLEDRVAKGLGQLKRLRYVRADDEAKAIAVRQQVFAGAVYCVEATDPKQRSIAVMATAVIDVFRSRSDYHNVDCLLASIFQDNKELDPFAQVLARRGIQIRRTACKQKRLQK